MLEIHAKVRRCLSLCACLRFAFQQALPNLRPHPAAQHERQTAKAPQSHSRLAAVAHVSSRAVVWRLPMALHPRYNGCVAATSL
jgi:hypothetical protein